MTMTVAADSRPDRNRVEALDVHWIMDGGVPRAAMLDLVVGDELWLWRNCGTAGEVKIRARCARITSDCVWFEPI